MDQPHPGFGLLEGRAGTVAFGKAVMQLGKAQRHREPWVAAEEAIAGRPADGQHLPAGIDRIEPGEIPFQCGHRAHGARGRQAERPRIAPGMKDGQHGGGVMLGRAGLDAVLPRRGRGGGAGLDQPGDPCGGGRHPGGGLGLAAPGQPCGAAVQRIPLHDQGEGMAPGRFFLPRADAGPAGHRGQMVKVAPDQPGNRLAVQLGQGRDHPQAAADPKRRPVILRPAPAFQVGGAVGGHPRLAQPGAAGQGVKLHIRAQVFQMAGPGAAAQGVFRQRRPVRVRDRQREPHMVAEGLQPPAAVFLGDMGQDVGQHPHHHRRIADPVVEIVGLGVPVGDPGRGQHRPRRRAHHPAEARPLAHEPGGGDRRADRPDGAKPARRNTGGQRVAHASTASSAASSSARVRGPVGQWCWSGMVA